MRIVFMGTPESAVPSLRRLVDDGHEIISVWTQPDKPAGRGKKLHQSPVKEFATEHNLEIQQPQKIRTPEARELFASHKADVAVVVAYGKILPNEFLAAPRHGCVNVHFSLLPKYRGAAPVNWAIINGEEQTGVTTMKIVEELDAGPILLKKATKIGEQETAPELLSRLSEIGADLLSETLRNLNEIESKPQLDSEATLAPILRREDGLIDWAMDAFAIERRVRGFQPWPNAFTYCKGQRLIIWRAYPRVSDRSEPAGQVVEAHGPRLVISCDDHTVLEVLELQAEGSRRMTTLDFNNGARLEAGAMLQ
ncbi:MAG: methionyl-tRNA formyltransferase [Acidobacteriota bacterium]